MSPHYVQHISPIHSILGLMKAGIGLALVPKAASMLQFEGAVLHPIEMRTGRARDAFATCDGLTAGKAR